MKNRKKRAQREEVRKILEAMRLELAAQRLAQEQREQNSVNSNSTTSISEIINNSKKLVIN